MFRQIVTYYARRIVNVNVNIVLAGLLALGPTLLVVRLVEHMFARGYHPNQRLGIPDKGVITGATFAADLFFDLLIYYVLHWLANHSGKQKRQQRLETLADAAVDSVPFFKDATKVQFQRLVLSPLLYLLWLGLQFTLMSAFHVRPVLATVIGFVVAITTTRTIHTIWMLKEERALRLAGIRAKRAAQAAAAKLGAEGVAAADRACRERVEGGGTAAAPPRPARTP